MGSRGESKTQKTVATEKIRFLNRKTSVWTIKNQTGPHSKKASVPLGFLLRDMLKISQSAKEAKKILNSGAVFVNGRIRKSHKFSVGLFDIISFSDGKKKYRITLDSKGRIKAVKMRGSSSMEKISKILKMKISKKGIVELTTNDGFVLKKGKEPVKVSDSLKISLPGKKTLAHFSFSTGKIALIIGGTHAGEVGTIKEVIKGSMHKPKLVKLQSKGSEFNTLEKYVCIVGDEKTALEMNLEGFEK